MSALRYGDYQGAVTYEDGRLVIQILHIEDTITTECDSASQAPAAFEELVKDYLATCEQVGKEPSKPFKGSFNVRVSPVLHKAAAMAAAEQGESLNSYVGRALECLIEQEKECKEVISAAQTEFGLLSLPQASEVWCSASSAQVPQKILCERQAEYEDLDVIFEATQESWERLGKVYKPATARGWFPPGR
jgi:predicted HicB family RNase H-like nuclease